MYRGYNGRGGCDTCLKPKLHEFNLKKSFSIEIWNDSHFKDVQCRTVKKSC